MRDPKRMTRILHLIYKIWTKYPDMRLFQLLGNPLKPEDHYHMEDDEIEEALKKYYHV